jgi:hypothetical protein
MPQPSVYLMKIISVNFYCPFLIGRRRLYEISKAQKIICLVILDSDATRNTGMDVYFLRRPDVDRLESMGGLQRRSFTLLAIFHGTVMCSTLSLLYVSFPHWSKREKIFVYHGYEPAVNDPFSFTHLVCFSILPDTGISNTGG